MNTRNWLWHGGIQGWYWSASSNHTWWVKQGSEGLYHTSRVTRYTTAPRRQGVPTKEEALLQAVALEVMDLRREGLLTRAEDVLRDAGKDMNKVLVKMDQLQEALYNPLMGGGPETMSAGFHLQWFSRGKYRWVAGYPDRVFWYFQIEETLPWQSMLFVQPPWSPAARVVQRELLSLHHKHQSAIRVETALGIGEGETTLGPFRSKGHAQAVAQSYLDVAIPTTVKMIQEKGTKNDVYFMGQLRRALDPAGQVALDQALEANQNPKKKSPQHYPWMKLKYTEPFIPLMKKRGAAKVARSYRGFYTAFKDAGGKPGKMGLTHPDTPNRDPYPWWQRRNEFIARHMAQVRKGGESLWDSSGNPTNRHLGLIAWAYTPDPDGVQQWVDQGA